MRSLLSVVAMLLGILGAGAAFAQSCTGVEERVNTRTSELSADVIENVETLSGELEAEFLVQRELLLSALNVLNNQTAASGEQEATATVKAHEAAANGVAAHSTRANTLDAQERYGTVGYNACGVLEQKQSFHEALAATNAAIAALMAGVANSSASNEADLFGEGVVGGDTQTSEDWFEAATVAEEVSAETLTSGDQERAQAYINFVMGPPVVDRPGIRDSAAGVSNTIVRREDAARRSVALYLLSATAAESREDGPDDQLAQVLETWIGEDGGEEWAAVLAASPTRAALLDLARLEAASIAAASYEMKKLARQELALATYVAARVDALIATGEANVRGR